jgi:hypothetical protein
MNRHHLEDAMTHAHPAALRAVVCVAAAVLLAGCLAGCTDSTDSAGDKAGADSSSPSGTPSQESATPSSIEPGDRSDPLAPTEIPPVIRGDETPQPSISADPQPFDEPIEYPDGVSLEVTEIEQGEVTDQGPGVVGGPTTAFEVVFTNGSKKPVDLNQVVVTAVYGDPGRLAHPVYDPQSRDFAGRVAPGEKAKARYVFSIPPAQLGNVTVHVDFDGLHAAGRFTGDAA